MTHIKGDKGIEGRIKGGHEKTSEDKAGCMETGRDKGRITPPPPSREDKGRLIP